MKKKIEAVVCVVCALLCVWLVICWADVILHNGMENPNYADWNIWIWLAKGR